MPIHARVNKRLDRPCSGRTLPGEDVLAGIRVGHGSKLCDDDLVGLGVSLVGLALQELTSVSHLT